MKLLLDTHVLLWAAGQPQRLSAAARRLLQNPNNDLLFSAASFWEIAIKNTLGRKDFRVEARVSRRGLLDSGYTELPVTSQHALNIDALPACMAIPWTASCFLRRCARASRSSPGTRCWRSTRGPFARYRQGEFVRAAFSCPKGPRGTKCSTMFGIGRPASMRTIPAREIKRRGIGAADEALGEGPVHVIKNDHPHYVILREDHYQELLEDRQQAQMARLRKSLEDLEAGRVQRFKTVDDLFQAIDEQPDE